MNHQSVLQRHLQTISKKCDEHMRIGAVFELMIDGPDAEFAFQGSKHTLDLRQLHVAGPQHRRVFAREIAAQQIVSVTLLGSLELRLVGVKPEGIAPDLFIVSRKLNLHESESAARFLLRLRRYASVVGRASADSFAWCAVCATNEPAV